MVLRSLYALVSCIMKRSIIYTLPGECTIWSCPLNLVMHGISGCDADLLLQSNDGLFFADPEAKKRNTQLLPADPIRGRLEHVPRGQ